MGDWFRNFYLLSELTSPGLNLHFWELNWLELSWPAHFQATTFFVITCFLLVCHISHCNHVLFNVFTVACDWCIFRQVGGIVHMGKENILLPHWFILSGDSFLEGLLVNGWLSKLVFATGQVENSIATWTFNLSEFI